MGNKRRTIRYSLVREREREREEASVDDEL